MTNCKMMEIKRINLRLMEIIDDLELKLRDSLLMNDELLKQLHGDEKSDTVVGHRGEME